jgi:hypothetical protein
VVRVTTYLEDTRDFGRYNKVFAEHFKDAVLAPHHRRGARRDQHQDRDGSDRLQASAKRSKQGRPDDQIARAPDSGNVQKVIFLLEEIAKPYTREDYGGSSTTPRRPNTRR